MLSCLILNNPLACGHESHFGAEKFGFHGDWKTIQAESHITLKSTSPAPFFSILQRSVIVGGSLVNKKAWETGPHLKELCILAETEYSHWKYKQHWPLSIGRRSRGCWIWTLGSLILGRIKIEWSREVLGKGTLLEKVWTTLFLLTPHIQSTRKSRSRSPESSHPLCLSPCSEPPCLA